MVMLIRFGLFFVLGYFMFAILAPGMDFWDAAKTVFVPIYVDVPLWLFDTFSDLNESFKTEDISNNNPAQDFGWLLMFLGTLALSLALPVLWWVIVTFLIWLSIFNVAPNLANGILTIFGGYDSSPQAENWKHIVNGRTTIQDTYDADVQANSIADALKNRK